MTYRVPRYWGCQSNQDHNRRVHAAKIAREHGGKSLGIPGRDRAREQRAQSNG